MQEIIEKYNLIPHIEGGYYREVYRSNITISSPIVNQKRDAITHIYFLLIKGEVSRFHKVLHDEIWNYYEGAPLRIIKYNKEISSLKIGPQCDTYCTIIEAGAYQAAETTGAYTLVGCSVAPGFDFNDFSFLNKNTQITKHIKEQYPDLQKFM